MENDEEHDDLCAETLDDFETVGTDTGGGPGGRKRKMKRDPHAMRKAPLAPKRFKSSYICFFMAKQGEIKEALGDEATVSAISKRSAEMWKNLPAEERAHWDEVAAKDKERYMTEKSTYTGPWQVPWKRAKKDPSAPKRPMSAFLQFSQGRRTRMKQENPELKNTDISRILGNMWRDASEDEKRPYVEKEKAEREKYKIEMEQWKKEHAAKQEVERAAQHQQYTVPALDPTYGLVARSPYMDPYGMVTPSQYMPPHASNPYNNNYGYLVGPYTFPTDGKQPVILGPTGTPVYPPDMKQNVAGKDGEGDLKQSPSYDYEGDSA